MVTQLDYAEVSELGRRLRLAQQMAPRKMDDWLHKHVGPRLKELMIEYAPKRSGALAASITQVNTPGAVSVGTQGIAYVKFIVEGTRPHEIRPKNGNVLAFKVGGSMVFSAVVHHPGTKANNFMEKAARKVMHENLSFLTGLGFGLKKNG